MIYTQCRLARGKFQKVAWIPSAFAVKNNFVRIKEEDGWRIIGVGKTLDYSYVKELERDHLTQRKASDI